MVFVESSKTTQFLDQDQWLGFVDAIHKIVMGNDGKVRQRFCKVQETVVDQTKKFQYQNEKMLQKVKSIESNANKYMEQQREMKKVIEQLKEVQKDQNQRKYATK